MLLNSPNKGLQDFTSLSSNHTMSTALAVYMAWKRRYVLSAVMKDVITRKAISSPLTSDSRVRKETNRWSNMTWFCDVSCLAIPIASSKIRDTKQIAEFLIKNSVRDGIVWGFRVSNGGMFLACHGVSVCLLLKQSPRPNLARAQGVSCTVEFVSLVFSLHPRIATTDLGA
jgi:hypothetical protein